LKQQSQLFFFQPADPMKLSETKNAILTRGTTQLISKPNRFQISNENNLRVGPFTEICSARKMSRLDVRGALTCARISFILISFALFNAERLVISWGS